MATATTTAVAQLNKVQYAGLDFPTHFDDLRSELQTKFAVDFNDFALSSIAIMLMDITAYGLDALSFYLDRRATDSYLETAQTRKAVARLTRQLGYKMGGAISASTDLSVRPTAAVNFTVTIPQGFQFKGPENLIFESAEAVTFAPKSITPQFIPVYEGETVVETFVGDGTASQVYQLQAVPSGKNVVQGSLKVLVNGTDYEEADFLPITGGQYFEVGYNDSPASIRFGDGTISQTDIPGPDSTISVTYIVATGLAGQVNANTITKVVTPLVVNFTTVSLTIANLEAAVGGDDPESIDRAKTLAPLVYKTRRVAVTQDDYVSLSSAFADPLFGRVAVAQAYSTRSAADDMELQQLLQDVRDVVTPVFTTVDAQTAVLTTQTTAITTQTSAQTTSLNAVVAANNTCAIGIGDAIDQVQQGQNLIPQITSHASSGQSTVASISTATGYTALTSASFTQPALGADVVVSVNNINSATIGSQVTIDSGGTYSIQNAPSASTLTLTLTAVGTGTAPGGTVTSGKAVTADPTDRLTVTTQNTLTSYFQNLNTDISTLAGYLDAALVELETANNALLLVGVNLTSGYLLQLNTSRASIVTATSVIIVSTGTIDTAIEPIDPAGSGTTSINAALDAINAHVDDILAANCSANLITVPILTKDANGFYAAPSLGLRSQLQIYLDARKAVTQTAQVVSGETALIYAVLTLQVAVRQGYSEGVVRLAVLSALDGLLKNRAFGVSLYRSDLVDTVLSVAGAAYVNLTINGYYTSVDPSLQTSKLDGFGNLVVAESEVATKGAVTVTTVPFS